MEKVVLVNTSDEALGTMEKMEAHRSGELHRAFSVLVFNSKSELLLQQRAREKYHSGGLWTNTCCSHPVKGESIVDAGKRRLKEEMGFSVELYPVHTFIYRAELDNNLIEHEYDHVLIGFYEEAPVPNSGEVQAWKYQSLNEIEDDLAKHPEKYTAWFRIILNSSRDKLLSALDKARNHNNQ